LFAAKGFTASAPAPEDDAATAPSAPEGEALVWPSRVVLRRERKGHGGKTVTRVEGLEREATRKAARKALGKALSVGVRVEGKDLLVQGDQRTRLAGWFREKGVKKVIET